MSIKINKNDKEYPLGFMPEHYPADRVYLDGDTNKTAQGEIDELQRDKASNNDIDPYIKSKISTTSVLPGNTLTFSLPVNPDILYEFKAMVANANDSAIASIIAIRTASKVIHSKLTTNDATSYSYADGKLTITLSNNYWLYSLRQINDEI